MIRKEMKCPLCGAITLCEWRFNMSPHMCVDHAGWFCLGCMRRIETTDMGQHFMASMVSYDSHGIEGSLHNPYRPEEGYKGYGTFRKHVIIGMPEEVKVFPHGTSHLAGEEDIIDVAPCE